MSAAILHSSVLHSGGGTGVAEQSSALWEKQSLGDCEGAVLMRKIMGEMTSSEVTIKVAAVSANLWSVVERLIQMHGAHTQQPIIFGGCNQQSTRRERSVVVLFTEQYVLINRQTKAVMRVIRVEYFIV